MRLNSIVFFSICLAYLIMFAHNAVPHHHHSSLEEAIEHHNSEECTASGHTHHLVHPDLENEQVLPSDSAKPIPFELDAEIDPFSFQDFESVNRLTGIEDDPPEYSYDLLPCSLRGPPFAGAVEYSHNLQ